MTMKLQKNVILCGSKWRERGQRLEVTSLYCFSWLEEVSFHVYSRVTIAKENVPYVPKSGEKWFWMFYFLVK